MPYYYLAITHNSLRSTGQVDRPDPDGTISKLGDLGQLAGDHLYRNFGAAFGILQSQTFLFIGLTLVVIVSVWVNRRRLPDYPRLFQIGLAIALGGALGNFSDRLRLGYVVDFIDLNFWPVFNIADMAIVSGVLLIIWGIYLKDRKDKASETPEPESQSGLLKPLGKGEGR